MLFSLRMSKLPFLIRLKTSSFRTIVLFYDKVDQIASNGTFYKYSNQSQNCSKLTCAVIGQDICRRSWFFEILCGLPEDYRKKVRSYASYKFSALVLWGLLGVETNKISSIEYSIGTQYNSLKFCVAYQQTIVRKYDRTQAISSRL
jgi:hypothetical protein